MDETYDALDELVAEMSKVMYQSQVEAFQNFETELIEIRRITVEAGNIYHSYASDAF